MNTKELYYALYHCPVTEPFFDGVYSSDHLEEIVIRPKLIITNTEPSTSSGAHWLLFFFYGQCVDVFDSYGRDLNFFNYDIQNFTATYAKYVNMSEIAVQPPQSNICGMLCLYVAYRRCEGETMRNIIKEIQDNLSSSILFVKKKFKLDCCCLLPYISLQCEK